MAATAGPRIIDVAEQILADIRRRKLRRGDAYRGTAETAQWLRVSGSTANRALQLLAQRGVVHRRQRMGTTVLDPLARGAGKVLSRVHLLVRRDHLRAEGLWSEGVLLGLQGALPGVDLRFSFRPEGDETEHVKQLIHKILRARSREGLVLIRSTVVSQRLVLAAGLPAVVSGTLQPSIQGLPSIDRDQRQMGVLLAQHLLHTKCRRFLILMRERLTAGDHAMLDGAWQTLAQANVPLANVTLRCLPSDPQAVTAEVRALLAQPPGKTGCLCRSEGLATAARDAFETLATARRRSSIVVADAARDPATEPPFPCIETVMAAEEWGAAIGNMLAAAARGEGPTPSQQVIPVRLRIPRKSK